MPSSCIVQLKAVELFLNVKPPVVDGMVIFKPGLSRFLRAHPAAK